MAPLLPFAASVLLSLLLPRQEPAPSNVDLEEALRSSAGEQFGRDDEEAPLRPYEVLLRMDVKSVPDDLLVGVLLAGATRGDPVDAARALMAQAGHDVARLRESGVWARTPGVGDAGRARIMAAVELARRLDLREAFSKRTAITGPQSAYEVLRSMALGPYESMTALYLDRRHRVISGRILATGTDTFTVTDPRQIFKEAVDLGAAAVVLAHNHPSGDPVPSQQDVDITRRVCRAGEALGINVLDHLVIGSEGRWSSLRQDNLMPPMQAPGPYVTGS